MVLRLQRLFGCLGMGALVAIALVPMPALAAASWHVSVGDQTSDAGVQANGFFNNNITVDVGDTVNWSWNAEEIHSVTFLSGAPEPLLFSPSGGQLNPNIPAFFPVGNGSSYDGTGFRSSGVFGTPFAPTNHRVDRSSATFRQSINGASWRRTSYSRTKPSRRVSQRTGSS